MRIFSIVVSIIVIVVVFAVIGLIVGATIGGNYFVDFQFAGQRGYEATGSIGFGIGMIFGFVLSAILLKFWKR